MILNAHSYYSLRYGTLSVEALCSLAQQRGQKSMALTDINCSTGCFEFMQCCKEKGIHAVIGMEFREENRLYYIVLARDMNGFRQINELRSRCNSRELRLPETPSLPNCFIIYPYGKRTVETLGTNEYIGIRPQELSRILFHGAEQKARYVVLQSVTFENDSGYDIHQKLCAVDHNILLSQLRKEMLADRNEQMPDREELEKSYAQHPELIRNTERLLDACHYTIDLKAIKNKKTFTGSATDDRQLLRKLSYDGLKFRYGKNNRIAKERVDRELEIIDELDFSSYFLITWDIIRYSMSRGYYHVGRGSGANSVVAYCLRITDVCPIELDLYFERFLNPKRKSPPDFDIDYSWKERDDVLDYIFKRYGKAHTALLGAMSTFKDRSIIRELGKVYGLPKEEIDRMIKQPNSPLNNNEICKEILQHYSAIEDYPNMRTIHACGVLISEEPITTYTALDLPPKGFATVQFDMYQAEDIGFEKFDILSQRGIGHIKEAADIIHRNRGISIDIHDVEHFKKDKRVAEQLRSGDTIGCFYIESPAMRGLLKKLRCDSYLTLVAASSIIRPGVASSGMMKAYIERFHRPHDFEYLHPVMKEQLKETYGVMVYQEDVLKVGHYFGGLDLADADVLRRMMSGKSRNKKHLDEIEDKFFGHCRAQGYPEEISREVWRQIESFAGYSFSKAHSASYAVESYQSLYLKTYYPLEFMVAVINNFGGFYNTRVYVNEAKMCGANIHLPCVNRSNYNTSISGIDIYLGFVHLKSLEQHLAELIETERQLRGPYLDLEDFVRRTNCSVEQLQILIRIDAFRFTGKNKRQLLWEGHLVQQPAGGEHQTEELFNVGSTHYELPELSYDPIEDVYDEMELLGFPVSKNYFELLKTDFRGDCMARQLIDQVGKKVRMVGSFVTTKPVRTKRGDMMAFGTFLDVEGKFFDTVHFPPSLKQHPFTGSGVYLILGKVVEEFGFPSLEVEKMARLPIRPDPRV